MNVLVTGGTGFIGRRLVTALLKRGALPASDGNEREIQRLRIVDVASPPDPLPQDDRLDLQIADIAEGGTAQSLLDGDTDVVYHLAAIVSGQAEREFDLGMRINFDGTRQLLDACRQLPRSPRFIFSSSVAVFGGDMPAVIQDDTPLMPQTSYGSQKAGSEFLVNDYSRKGFVDGRCLRLPTIVVRGGKPNAAASSFASAVLREPLQGDAYRCPVSAQTGVWILSPRAVVECFLHATDLDAAAFGSHRSLCLPGITVSVGDMIEAMRDIAGSAVADRVQFLSDPFIEKIVAGWPTQFAPQKALSMGFKPDSNIHDIINQFIEDELAGSFTA